VPGVHGLCREQSLFGAELLAIDGTKIAEWRAASKWSRLNRSREDAAIERKIAEYFGSDGRG